jgi:hypothetical protein
MEKGNDLYTSLKYLETEEMKKLLDTAHEHHAEHLLIRLLACGMAPRDIVRLRAKSFKYDDGVAKFTGKNGVKRIVNIDIPTLTFVKKYVEHMDLERTDTLFPWTERRIHDVVQEAGKVAKLAKDVTPTMLRDTWVFHAVRDGKDEEYIGKQLGNADAAFTRALVQSYRALDERSQPKVNIYIPVHEKRLNIIEGTLKAMSRLDWKNYVVTLLVNNTSPAGVTQFRSIASKYGAEVMDLGVINTREEIVIEGTSFEAEIDEGGVISIVRKALFKGAEAFRKGDSDYFLVCGSDCRPHPDGIKRLEKYFHDKRFPKAGIVGGIIFARGTMRVGEGQKVGMIPCVFYDAIKRKNAPECYEFLFKNYMNLEALEVDGVGSGWAMYSRKVIEQVDWELPKDLTRFMGEDYYYCHQAGEKGFTTVCVCDILADHLEDGEEVAAPAEVEAPKSEPGPAPAPGAPKFKFEGEFTSEFYDEEYFERGVQTGKSGYGGYYNHPLFKAIARELKGYFTPKRVLDVGAAMGFMVQELAGLGVDAHGIDISEYAVGGCPEAVTSRLVCGRAEKLPWENGDFDLVVSFDMLEHLNETQYRAAIREMARVSSKNLLFSITTDDHVIDQSHISVMPIEKWVAIVDSEIGGDYYRHKNNFLDQSILWFSPRMCLIYTRRKK